MTTPSHVRVLGEHESHPVGERCPWCDQPVSHQKFDEIRLRIEAAERKRTAEIEHRLKEEIAREKAAAEERSTLLVAEVQKRAADAMAAAKIDGQAATEAGRREAAAAVHAEVEAKLQEAARLKALAEQQVAAVNANQEEVLRKRLEEQRAALEKAQTAAVNVEKSKAFNDNLKLEGKLAALQRQLQKKTADELGEGAEVDLFEALRAEFPMDSIVRVKKGEAGADIIHKVIADGRHSGTIVYDSKNRNVWQNAYATKLRKDQVAARADHAILTTQVFPSGQRQLHMQDGVIVSNPARVVAVVGMLRRHSAQMHSLRLSNNERDEKMDVLYAFIMSERCAQLLDQVETAAINLLELDVKEKKAHDLNWNRRGELIKSVQRAHGNLSSEIDQITSKNIEPSVAVV